MSNCLNCERPLDITFKYCPYCSQKSAVKRLSFREMLHDAFHYFTHADKGLLVLIKDLLLKTGLVAKEFISGKRKRHFPPLNFFLLVATVLVLVFTVLPSRNKNIPRSQAQLTHIKDPVKKARVALIYERQYKAISFMNKYSNIVAMIAVPLICIIYWSFYRKSGYNYVENLVSCMYMTGITNLIYACIFVPLSILINIKGPALQMLPLIIFFLFQVLYNSVFYYRFTGGASKASAAKAFGVSIFAVGLWFVGSSWAVSSYIKYGAWWIV